MESKWYEQFFYGLAVDLWRKAMPEEQTRDEAVFIAEALNLQPGARVLDVPCGLGRHSIELSRGGYQMTGVDLSDESINEARRSSAAAGLSIDWIRTDMNEMDRTCGPEQFDGAFCFGKQLRLCGLQHDDRLPAGAEPLSQVRRRVCLGHGPGRGIVDAEPSDPPVVQSRRHVHAERSGV